MKLLGYAVQRKVKKSKNYYLRLRTDVAAAKSRPPERETGRALLSLDVGNNPQCLSKIFCLQVLGQNQSTVC